jgi:gluconate 2-dehydrogenase gamma chain
MTGAMSRRGFLASAVSAAGAAWLAANWPALAAAAAEARAAHAAGEPLQVLGAEEAADLAAIAARILPSDELPGATEAGVVHFIDRALGGFMAPAAPALRKGLKALNRKAGARFASLGEARQVDLLKAEESSDFFGTVHFLTVAGAFALPSYGGNRDHAGWKLLGFEHRHAWAPPFGHYDAAAGAAEKKP